MKLIEKIVNYMSVAFVGLSLLLWEERIIDDFSIELIYLLRNTGRSSH